jgi:hypothetical protein
VVDEVTKLDGNSQACAQERTAIATSAMLATRTTVEIAAWVIDSVSCLHNSIGDSQRLPDEALAVLDTHGRAIASLG